MAQVMRHKEWMEASYGSKLKAVDNALLKFDKQPTQQNIQNLQGALVSWMTSKGNAWKSSVRNKNKAVETLFAQITSTSASFGAGDGAALDILKEEPREVKKTLFNGAKIDWKSTYSTQLNSDGTKPRITVSQAVKRAPKQYKLSASTNKSGTALNTGGPDEAIGAMIRILERERNADVFRAGVSLTEFGGKLAGLAVNMKELERMKANVGKTSFAGGS